MTTRSVLCSLKSCPKKSNCDESGEGLMHPFWMLGQMIICGHLVCLGMKSKAPCALNLLQPMM